MILIMNTTTSLQKSGLKFSNHMNKFFIIIFSMTIVSCTTSTIINPWRDYEYVYDSSGRTHQVIKEDRPHYMLYSTLDWLEYTLADTPKGKIDKIIKENPSWQFLFYCNCSVSDSLRLMNLLESYECTFPVIIDHDKKFLTTNDIHEPYSQIGFICNKKGKCLGVSTIGTRRSFFDQEFLKAKGKI